MSADWSVFPCGAVTFLRKARSSAGAKGAMLSGDHIQLEFVKLRDESALTGAIAGLKLDFDRTVERGWLPSYKKSKMKTMLTLSQTVIKISRYTRDV